jgi:hypothetical protein
MYALTYSVFSLYWKLDGQPLGVFTYENKWAVALPIREADSVRLLGQAVNYVHAPQKAPGGVLRWQLHLFAYMKKEPAWSHDIICQGLVAITVRLSKSACKGGSS